MGPAGGFCECCGSVFEVETFRPHRNKNCIAAAPIDRFAATSPVNGGRMRLQRAPRNSSPVYGGGVSEADGGGSLTLCTCKAAAMVRIFDRLGPVHRIAPLPTGRFWLSVPKFYAKPRPRETDSARRQEKWPPHDQTKGVRARTGIALALRKINAIGRAVATGRSAAAARKMLANALCNQIKLSDAP